ncbi:MAG: hypothetical protein JO202_12980 [Ktedonobacteraceae bacterium]|nr:hypothetical protein [Ktedonobacteraceae bacterium]
MMSHMDPGSTQRDEGRSAYGRYEENRGYNQQGGTYDDEHIDMLVQRLSQRMGQSQKIYPTTNKAASAGQRMALAIVSVMALIPLTAIIVGAATTQAVPWGVTLFALGAAYLAVFLINAVFNTLSPK